MRVSPFQTFSSCFIFLFFGSFATAQDKKPVQTIFSSQKGPHGFLERWELVPETRKGTFIITPYKPMTITAGRWSNEPNLQPFSENPAYSATTPLAYNHYEAKYNISFKLKVFQGMLKHRADLWIAYSQKSHWQLYNTELSRPFRETNYEPEVILNFPLNFKLFGMDARMAGIAFNHQSNGRSLPYSRSWNRIIAHFGLEKGRWATLIRGWYRLADDEDENPAICDYIGRGDATVIFKPGKHSISLMASHSLRFGDKNHGMLQADWVFPVIGNMNGHVQAFHGYGETLIDYNHRQTGVGLGICLVNWL